MSRLRAGQGLLERVLQGGAALDHERPGLGRQPHQTVRQVPVAVLLVPGVGAVLVGRRPDGLVAARVRRGRDRRGRDRLLLLLLDKDQRLQVQARRNEGGLRVGVSRGGARLLLDKDHRLQVQARRNEGGGLLIEGRRGGGLPGVGPRQRARGRHRVGDGPVLGAEGFHRHGGVALEGVRGELERLVEDRQLDGLNEGLKRRIDPGRVDVARLPRPGVVARGERAGPLLPQFA